MESYYNPAQEAPSHSSFARHDLEALKRRRNWMGTRFKPRKGSGATGKTDKPPHRVRDGRPIVGADKTEPDNWATYGEALAALKRGAVDAIGYVVTEDDPFFVVDLDGVIDRDTGEIDGRASQVIHALAGYTEVSCSGTGVHIVAQGKKPAFAKCKSKALGIDVEVYDSARFVVLTGQRITDVTGAPDRDQELEELCRTLWPSEATRPKTHNNVMSSSFATVDVDDLELLERARRSRTGPRFRALYDAGDCAGYASASEADYGLLNMLIFWTAGDRGRIIRLFEASALYRDASAGKHRDYVRRSVDNALASYVGNFYRPRDLSKARRQEPSEADPLTPYLEVLLDPSLWTGRRGASAYKAYAGAVIRAAEHGVVDDEGNLRIGCDTRTLAEIAGVNLRTLNRSALPYLMQEMKVLRWRRGKGRQAGTFVLKKPPVSSATNKVSTHFIGGTSHNPKHALETLRLLIRMRSGHAKSAKLLRLGMPAMFTTIALAITPRRGQNIEELVERTGRRKSDLRRVLVRLKAAGIVREISREFYRLTDDFAAQYELRLEQSGITYSEREQRRRHARDRRARDERLPVDSRRRPLCGKEHNRRTLEEQRKKAKERYIEEQRKKVGTTALTFLADELASPGTTAVSFEAARRRWLKRGGSTKDLRRAVYYGPFTFRREVDGDLYVYREPEQVA